VNGLRIAGELERHPVARHQHDILRQRRDFGGLRTHLSALDQTAENLLGDPNLVGQNAPELDLDHVIAGDEIVDVPIDKPIF
jgi:hypothetical protein